MMVFIRTVLHFTILVLAIAEAPVTSAFVMKQLIENLLAPVMHEILVLVCPIYV